MKRYILLLILISPAFKSFGQLSNGRVNSLIAAENYFAKQAQEKGTVEAILKVSDQGTIVFRPHPINAKQLYYKTTSNDAGSLKWEPFFAKISRSGDWGFTSGPFSYSTNSASPIYGQYLSIWHTNNKGQWKLSLDTRISHQKPIQNQEKNITDPNNYRFFRQLSPNRLKQREDMITTTDKLFSNTLLRNQDMALENFLAKDTRLLLQGYEPIIGKEKVINFLNQNKISISTIPLAANRALGSDLAYSYGTALISRNNTENKYYYVRIWESQEEFKWNVILEIFSPAEN
ncbi:hypothetical protein [Daejeonella sp. H1SJ63]|uniref:hypothetical protein n=1 Tax=Daejeonella sp. H1SJ63 TaxID=3034145 RepID=UPI0023EC8A4D|nr:hypothetical protein [Daejeonella sp. H1SJ63]